MRAALARPQLMAARVGLHPISLRDTDAPSYRGTVEHWGPDCAPLLPGWHVYFVASRPDIEDSTLAFALGLILGWFDGPWTTEVDAETGAVVRSVAIHEPTDPWCEMLVDDARRQLDAL